MIVLFDYVLSFRHKDKDLILNEQGNMKKRPKNFDKCHKFYNFAYLKQYDAILNE